MRRKVDEKKEMGKNFITGFKGGRWLSWSNSILGSRQHIAALLALLPRYVRRNGVEGILGDLRLIGHYVSDIAHGRYRNYDSQALTLAVAAIAYAVSPIDLTPDFVPLGLLDDATVITWALSQLGTELEKYKQCTVKS